MPTALTSSDRVKRFLAVTGTTLDALIDELIPSVSEAIESYTGRVFASTAVTGERHDGPGVRGRITLAHYPVISVQEVREGYTTPDVLVEGTDFDIDAKVGQLVRLSDGAPTNWQRGERVIGVDYTHGFASVPEDVAHAATLQVAWQVKQSDQRGGGLGYRTQGIGDWSAGSVTDAWLPEVREVLDRYRNTARIA